MNDTKRVVGIVAIRQPGGPTRHFRILAVERQYRRVAQQILRTRRNERDARAGRDRRASTDCTSSARCVTCVARNGARRTTGRPARPTLVRARCNAMKPISLSVPRSAGTRFRPRCGGTASASASSITLNDDKPSSDGRRRNPASSLPARNRRVLLRGRQVAQRHGNAGIPAAKFRDELRDERQHRQADAQPQCPRCSLDSSRARTRISSASRTSACASGRKRSPNAVSSAPCRPRSNSFAAEARLERADLLAQCRLAHVQRIGRAAEMAQLGDRQEGSQQFQFHS